MTDEELLRLLSLGQSRSADPALHERLKAIVRFVSDNTAFIVFGQRAEVRMVELGITSDDVYRVLRRGDLVSFTRCDDDGSGDEEWCCRVVARPPGSRRVSVITIVLHGGYVSIDSGGLFVETVEWDLQ